MTTEGGEEADDDSIVGRARDMVQSYIQSVAEEGEERALTADQVLEHFKDNSGWFDPIVDAFLAAVRDRAPGFVEEFSEYHLGFNERLRGYYGDALDGFLAFVNLCVESASGVYTRGVGQVDTTGEVLLDLHARGCLVAHEIHTLLSNGYPFGALASWRTVHELSVIASVIEEFGRANDSDLTKRWGACDGVIHYKDAQIYQERVERLNYQPLSEELVETLKQRKDEAVLTYGKGIAQSNGYGWAVEICAPETPSFRRLEELAGRGHLRGHYRWASHRVHGDSRGNAHNRMTRGDQTVRLAGATNVGLLDAADLTLSSLWILTNCVLTGLRDDEQPEAEEVVMMLALGRLQERVSQSFVDADACVHETETALQREEGRTDPES